MHVVFDGSAESADTDASKGHLCSSSASRNGFIRSGGHGGTRDTTTQDRVDDIISTTEALDGTFSSGEHHTEAGKTLCVRCHGGPSLPHTDSELESSRTLHVNSFVNSIGVTAKEKTKHQAETAASNAGYGSFEDAGLEGVFYGELDSSGRVGVLWRPDKAGRKGLELLIGLAWREETWIGRDGERLRGNINSGVGVRVGVDG